MTDYERAALDASFQHVAAKVKTAETAALEAQAADAIGKKQRLHFKNASGRLGELDARMDELFSTGLSGSEAEPWLRCFAATLAWYFLAEVKMTGRTFEEPGTTTFRDARADRLRSGLRNRFPSVAAGRIDHHVENYEQLSNAQCVQILGVTAEEWLHYRWSHLCPRHLPATAVVLREEKNAKARKTRYDDRRALGRRTAEERQQNSGTRIAETLGFTRSALYKTAASATDCEADFLARIERRCRRKGLTLGAPTDPLSICAMSVNFWREYQGRGLQAPRPGSSSSSSSSSSLRESFSERPVAISSPASEKKENVVLATDTDAEIERLLARPEFAARIEKDKADRKRGLLARGLREAPAMAAAKGLDSTDPDVLAEEAMRFVDDCEAGAAQVRKEAAAIMEVLDGENLPWDEYRRRFTAMLTPSQGAA